MPPSDPDSLRVDGVTRRYGSRRALDDVSFAVEGHRLCALCGGNGAGKTTLLRVIAGYLDADGGRVSVPAGARLGYLPEGAPMPPELTVGEYVRHRAALAGGGDVDHALTECNIADRRHDAIGKLSKGLRQRAALAGVLVASPSVLLLDEPASGLDEQQRAELRTTLRALSETRTILWSTHELADVELIADQLVLLAAGRVIASGTVASIKALANLPDAPLRDAIIALTRGSAQPPPTALSEGERSEPASKGGLP